LKTLTAFIFAILLIHATAAGQNNIPDAKVWAKKLSDPSDKKNEASFKLDTLLTGRDSATIINFINQLGKQPSSHPHYFIARYNCLITKQLKVIYHPDPEFLPFMKDSIKKEVNKLMEQAMREAFIVDDDYLAAYVSSVYGAAMATFENTDKAVMYMMYSADLYQKVGLFGKWQTYIVLGEMLWRVREYEKAIQYTKIAIPLLIASGSPYTIRYLMMAYNTIGLAYHRMKNYDSARFYYNKALGFASQVKDKKTADIWYGIINGNIAQIDYAEGKFTVALPKFIMDYQTNEELGVYDDAANSAQWAAKTNLALGNKKDAVAQIRECFRLLQKWPHADNYRQNSYQTAAEIFKALGNKDSASYYSDKYNTLHDSIEKEIYQSSVSISELRLNNEKDRYNIQKLEQEKSDQLQKRNYLIGAILLIFVIVLLLINRQRQKLKFKSKIDDAEKARINGEMESARMQLKMFTQNIVEKSNLIEKLESQLRNKIATSQETQMVHDLTHQTILTEEDWLNFKRLFEKIHPDFFEKINKHVDNITQAEQRMAALTLLHLTTKQMSAVLGISPNSVIKAKQRLRQRLNVQTDQQAEEFIENI
jgi:DNA-binding CsgD family transcriptional regulator